MSAAEARKKFNITGGFVDERNRSEGSRPASAICQDHAEREVYRQAVQALRDLQGSCQTDLYNRPVRLTVDVYAKTQGDYDNCFKAAADSLQGYAYKNDKQVRGCGSGRIHDNKN